MNKERVNMQTLFTQKVKISGMTCGACAKLISKRISKIDGVQDIKIENNTGETEIVSTQDLDISAIQNALGETEYKVVNL
ncbi:MAG: heavy metal-associated domain-containing protein [bacterium]|nr:heavy metal-associated domain-containing protein [bacterium]